MMNVIVSILIVYVATSVWETFVHWKILHASRNSRILWKRLGGVFNLLRKAHFSHNAIHHKKTYNNNYYTQFDSAKKKQLLDSKLKARPHFRIIGDRYGLSISGLWENAVFIAVPIIVSLNVFMYLAKNYIILGLVIALIPMLLSKYVHPLLHEKNPLDLCSPIIVKHIARSKYFAYIQMYHYIHHEYALCNFNLMPGGDYLLGVARTMTPKPHSNTGIYNQVGYRITKPFTGRAKSARR